MEKIAFRIRTTGPRRRAGLELGPLGQWGVHVLELAAVEALNRLLALVLDPKIEVQVGRPKVEAAEASDDFDWRDPPSADEIRAIVDAAEADAQVVTATADLTGASIGAIVEGLPAEGLAADPLADASTSLPPIEPTLERPADDATGNTEIPASTAAVIPSPQEAPVAEAPVAVKSEPKPKAAAKAKA